MRKAIVGGGMGKEDREYEAFQIFEQINESAPYYEIEYDSCPLPGVGKFVLKSDRIEPRERDEVRERFDQMREIVRENRWISFNHSKFYDERTRRENARIFYRQGMFMKDFEDTYEKVVPYSSYFPSYQMMGYEQLRTYFTWRTLVRQGTVQRVSLSYAFLYLYELLNNIGTEGPQDALDKLMSFWDVYRVYDASVDKYVLKWLKDYHIYYELPRSFKEFTEGYGLTEHYPGLADPKDDFALFCSVSKYDIRKSAFYLEGCPAKGSPSRESFSQSEGGFSERREETDRETLIRDCFSFTMDRLRQVFGESHIRLDESVFQPTKSKSVWTPFREALFYPAAKQRDRQVILSEKESYQCCQNNWTHSTVITSESGRRLIGYIMKQMEAVLRKLTKYKHKLSANLSMLSNVMREELEKEGISLEKAVTDAVTDFYREATRTVVRVDAGALERIRREALATQEKLIVPEEAGFGGTLREAPKEEPGPWSILQAEPEGRPGPLDILQTKAKETGFTRDVLQEEFNEMSDSREYLQNAPVEDFSPWSALRAELTETELSALRLLSEGGTDIKRFADEHGIMLEILADGINEKAADMIGDSLLDGELMIYDDYIEQVKGMVESI